jgi:hypothetical protein
MPMAWLGGVAVVKAAEWLRAVGLRASYRKSVSFALVATLVVAGAFTPLRFGTVAPPDNPIAIAMASFRSDAPAGTWVVTDEAIDAYRAGVLVPPELAVFTGKRVRQGYLPSGDIILAIRKHQPSQVMFRRFDIDPDVRDSSYVRLVGSAEPHYIRSDLARENSRPITGPAFAWPQ